MFNTPQEAASELSVRINQLNAMSDADLKIEMQELKTAIKENPAACSLLLPEDIGQMVAALRRVTGFAIQQAISKPTKRGTSKAKTQLTPEQLAAALDDEDF